MEELAIKDVAERTGLGAGTVRMWEQRYGFPTPRRTPAGYRRYSSEDVEVLRRAVALKAGGLSIPAALARAREATVGATDRPSIYGAVLAAERMPIRPRKLRKRTLLAMSRAIEDEAMASASGPVCFGAFQQERFYRPVEHRYQRLARQADVACVFADFAEVHQAAGGPLEVPIDPDSTLGQEWTVIVDAPGFGACLIAWEESAGGDPDDLERRFEALWTLDPRTVRHASRAAAGLVAHADPVRGAEVRALLEDRPTSREHPTSALTALTNRMVEYLD